ncbi:hypothetical protein JMUB7525_27510 [Staphylococcus aureus]
MTIAHKIKDFPVTAIEQTYWVFDQHINDRGIKLSKSLMLGANDLRMSRGLGDVYKRQTRIS